MKKEKKKEITGFITRTRRSKKAVLTVSYLARYLRFNKLFTDVIKNNKYESVSVLYTEKHVYLKFFKNYEGTFPLYKASESVCKSSFHLGFYCPGLKKYLLKDVYKGEGIAHYTLSFTKEKDTFALKCIDNDFE